MILYHVNFNKKNIGYSVGQILTPYLIFKINITQKDG